MLSVIKSRIMGFRGFLTDFLFVKTVPIQFAPVLISNYRKYMLPNLLFFVLRHQQMVYMATLKSLLAHLLIRYLICHVRYLILKSKFLQEYKLSLMAYEKNVPIGY